MRIAQYRLRANPEIAPQDKAEEFKKVCGSDREEKIEACSVIPSFSF
jgi:hypothetical protein